MAAERRDEMARQERYEDEEGEFALENGGSGPDQTDTDPAILDDLMESRTEIRDWLECPICLGIIKKTRIVVECMHRFCGDCIEQVLEKGMNDCPICRCHIPSRTSLKDDSNFDGLVEAVCKVVEKCGDKRNEAPSDECEKQTKVRRIIGSPSNQTSPGSGDETSDRELSESPNPIPNGQINNDEEHVHVVPEQRLDNDNNEATLGMAERMMESMVLPEVRSRAKELPVEEQDSICCNVYRCIVPYLEVLYLLEEKEGVMKKEVEAYMKMLNQVLHLTMEGLKEKLQGKLEHMEGLISRAVGKEDAKAVMESLRDGVSSNVESELGKFECERGRIMENYSSLHATCQAIADLIIIKAQPRGEEEGWKKWYKCRAEYERDLKDAAAVYYKIGKSAMKKITCGAILQFCPSFHPSQLNLFNPSDPAQPPPAASLTAPPI